MNVHPPTTTEYIHTYMHAFAPALGTMSVSEALNAFSIETVVAGKNTPVNEDILKGLEAYANYLLPMNPAVDRNEL